MVTLYIVLICFALIAYLHIALTYLFSVRYLALLEKSENYHLLALALSFSLVCVLSLWHATLDPAGNAYPFVFNFVMLAVMLAKCFYFASMRKLLNASFPVDRIYRFLSFFYAAVSLFFLWAAKDQGLGAYFDLSKPELSGLPLREQLLPYDLKTSIKLLFLPNYVLGFAFYCYLLAKAYKKKEKLLAFGVFFTIVSILFTNSYHLFATPYWIPLNIVADLFELARLHLAQKERLKEKVDEYNRRLALTSIELEELKKKESQFQVYKHDLKNDLSVSTLNLHKAKLILKKVEDPLKDTLLECVDRSLTAQRLAADFARGGSLEEEIDLEKTFERLAMALGARAKLKGVRGVSLKTVVHKFENAMVNLLKNALEANCGDPSFFVEIEFLAEGDNCVLKITDSGSFKKLAKNLQAPELVFEKGVSTKAGSDRGIGLYSVRQFAREAGGDISLINNDGRVCFILSLPSNKWSTLKDKMTLSY